MTTNMTRYIKGAVKIRISCAVPEKLINLCVAEGIFLWGISRKEGDLFAWILLDDFYRLRPLVRKTRSHVKVITYTGWPFLQKKIMNRKMMVAGFVLLLVTVQVLASYIWFIEIIGTKAVEPRQILAVTEQQGLKRGTQKNLLQMKEIEDAILYSVPEIAWVNVRYKGTKAVIEVVEKTMPKPEDKKPAHIVADKDGIIAELIVIAGQAVVKKGDTVKKGDLIISGIVKDQGSAPSATGNKNPAPQPATQAVKAHGIVQARCWYESYGEAKLVQEVRQRTGQRETDVYISVADREIPVKRGPTDFGIYDEEAVNKTLPLWRNHQFPVESKIVIRHEVLSYQHQVTEEEARDEASAAALQAVQDKIPEGALIVNRKIETLKLNETKLARVKVSVETVEDIGRSVMLSEQ